MTALLLFLLVQDCFQEVKELWLTVLGAANASNCKFITFQ